MHRRGRNRGRMRWGQQIGPGRAYAVAVEQQGVPADAVWRYREDVWRLASSCADIARTPRT